MATGVAPIPASADEPSFDCSMAETTAARTICDDMVLAILDQHMASVYERALAVADDPHALKQAQHKWLEQRNACGDDTGCIGRHYMKRLGTLRTQVARALGKTGYRLVQGKGYSVCEAFARVLEGRTRADPMVCSLGLGENTHGFGHPDWQHLDIDQHLVLFRRLDQAARADEDSALFDGKDTGELTSEEWRREYEWRRRQPDIGEPELVRAELGLDGEGADDPVLGISWGNVQCTRRMAQRAGPAGFVGRYALFLAKRNDPLVPKPQDPDRPESLEPITSREYFVADFQGRDFLFETYYSEGAAIASVHVSTLEWFGGGPRRGAVARCKFDMPLNVGAE